MDHATIMRLTANGAHRASVVAKLLPSVTRWGTCPPQKTAAPMAATGSATSARVRLRAQITITATKYTATRTVSTQRNCRLVDGPWAST